MVGYSSLFSFAEPSFSSVVVLAVQVPIDAVLVVVVVVIPTPS